MNKKKFVSALAIFLLGLAAHADKPVSITGNFNGHGYELVPDPITWHLAKKKAEKTDGYLAVITSQEENQFIYDLIKKATRGEGCNAWIGLTDEKYEGSWEWVNGEKTAYVNWNEGEPNNFGYGFLGGSEHSVHMMGSGNWNVYASDGRTPYIIEYDHETDLDETAGKDVSNSNLRSTR